MAVPTQAATPALSDVEFCAWIAQAEPGERLEYHRGFLGIDTTPGISTLPPAERGRLVLLGAAARRAFEAGLVHLVQLRLAPDRFAYLAVARPALTSKPVHPASLLAEPEAA